MNKDENKYKSKDHLFIFKTTTMVNKREKNLLYNFYFRQTAVLVLYFFNFIPFLLLFSSFSLPFSFIFPPLLDISERNFFPGWGGGVHVHPLHPPLRMRLLIIQKGPKIKYLYIKFGKTAFLCPVEVKEKCPFFAASTTQISVNGLCDFSLKPVNI